MPGVNRSFDVCILCAKADEAQAVVKELTSRRAVSPTLKQGILQGNHSYRYEYDYAEMKNKDEDTLSLFITSLPQQGPVKTAAFVTFLLKELCPRFIVMTGYCAGDKRELHLGDLVVAEAAYHYEEGKVKKGEILHSPLIRPKGPAENIVQYIHRFTVSGSWKKPVTKLSRSSMANPLVDAPLVKCLIRYMASGMAVRRDDPFEELRSHNHNTVALDMEAASFYEAASSFADIYSLVVKGVCDYADMNKDDAYHDYAARASAVYLLSFIQEYVTEQTMPRRDSPSIRAEPSGIERHINMNYGNQGIVQTNIKGGTFTFHFPDQKSPEQG